MVQALALGRMLMHLHSTDNLILGCTKNYKFFIFITFKLRKLKGAIIKVLKVTYRPVWTVSKTASKYHYLTIALLRACRGNSGKS